MNSEIKDRNDFNLQILLLTSGNECHGAGRGGIPRKRKDHQADDLKFPSEGVGGDRPGSQGARRLGRRHKGGMLGVPD